MPLLYLDIYWQKEIWLPFPYNAAAIRGHLQQNKHLTSSFGNVIVQDSRRIVRNRLYSSSYSLLVLVRRASTWRLAWQPSRSLSRTREQHLVNIISQKKIELRKKWNVSNLCIGLGTSPALQRRWKPRRVNSGPLSADTWGIPRRYTGRCRRVPPGRTDQSAPEGDTQTEHRHQNGTLKMNVVRHYCQPRIPIYMQFASLFAKYEFSQYEIRYQWM